MECVIDANNLKVFGKAIHALARIGTELYVEDITAGLALRTVNSSKSAYASITFNQSFFHSYQSGINVGADDSDEAFKCKVDMKACLAIFKSLPVIEKTIEKCTLDMQCYDTRLTIKLFCINNIVKTIELSCIESESLKTVFSKDDCRNFLCAAPDLLRCAFNSFKSNQDEVTLHASPELVVLNNYVDERLDSGTIKVLHTERRLDPDEFISYEVHVNTEVTFSLKDLRAVLVFCDASNESVSIHFEAPGKPIVFAINDQLATFEGNFVFATLDSEENQQNKQSQSTNASNRNEYHTMINDKSTLDPPPQLNTWQNPSRTNFETRASTSLSSCQRVERTILTQKEATREFSNDLSDPPPEKRLRPMSPESPAPVVYEVLASDTDDEY